MFFLFAQATADPAAAEAANTPAADAASAAPVAETAASATQAAAETVGAAADAASAGSFDFFSELAASPPLSWLIDGGIFMWPLLIMGIIVLGVVIERYRSLKMLASDSGRLRDEVLDLLQQDRVEEALRRCDSEQGPVPAILAAGLRKYLVLRKLNYDPAAIEEQVVKAMDDYSVHIVAALERHLPVLGTLSSVAPMVGFLGTVQGMIVSFGSIVERFGEEPIVIAAAGGIMVALYTTCFGLVVGIPAYMAYNYFSGVINNFVLEVEEAGTELIETVTLELAMEGGARDGHSPDRFAADGQPVADSPSQRESVS